MIYDIMSLCYTAMYVIEQCYLNVEQEKTMIKF